MRESWMLEIDNERLPVAAAPQGVGPMARGTINLAGSLEGAHVKDVGASLLDAANAAHLARDYASAEKHYDQLLTQNPDNPGLLATVGTMYLQMDKLGLAIALLTRAVEKLPQSDILCNLGTAYKYSGQYKKAHEYFKRAVGHKPTVGALANYAALFVNVGEPEKGIELAKRAIKMEPEHALAHWNLAICHLEKGEFAQGWDEQEWGFTSGMRVRRTFKDRPYWDGTPGKRLHVYGEQGLGDEIMFASMLPDVLAQNDVILECHPRLKTIFEKSFPGIPVIGTRDKSQVDWPNEHEFDCSVSIGSLGKWFRRSREAFPGTPYLKADPLPKGDKFRIGISWIGGQKEGRVRTRSIPLAWWMPILDTPGCEFVSLQYTDSDADIDAVNRTGYDIQKAPEAKAEDYYETARLVASCDLVISCCTSVVHLAGALGVPTWCLTPSKPAWRYGVSGGMPWYRSVRLYRQPQGDVHAWRPVIERVAFDLRENMNSERMAA